MRQIIYMFILLLILGLLRQASAGQVLTVAVAANFAPALREMADRFTLETGVPVQMVISSSGKLFAQLENRAPFDLFFSADAERPEKLYLGGRCLEPKLYARGRNVLWTRRANLCGAKDWRDVVASPEVRKIAIANPRTAPYGEAAREACSGMTNWPVIEQKLVYGTNVGQAFQYAETGAVDAAFVALSLALSDPGMSGCAWEMAEAPDIAQKACVVGYSRNKEVAGDLLEYVMAPGSADIRRKYGYH
jgi:molybdate transport system substrate-binding protein